MKVAFDTGFFIKLLENNEKVTQIWEDVVEGKAKAYVSSMVLYELKLIQTQNTFDQETQELILNSIQSLCTVDWPSHIDELQEAFSTKDIFEIKNPILHFIAASCLKNKVNTFYTTDKTFKDLLKNGINTVVID